MVEDRHSRAQRRERRWASASASSCRVMFTVGALHSPRRRLSQSGGGEGGGGEGATAPMLPPPLASAALPTNAS